MTDIPTGYVVDHHAPQEWIVTCPDCEDRQRKQSLPDTTDRHCTDCDRMKGVTPIRRGCGPRADGGTVMTDGGTDE